MRLGRQHIAQLSQRTAARRRADDGTVIDIATGGQLLLESPEPSTPRFNVIAVVALVIIVGILGAATMHSLQQARPQPGAASSLAAGPGAPATIAALPEFVPVLPGYDPMTGAPLLDPGLAAADATSAADGLAGILSAPAPQAVLPPDGQPVLAAPPSGPDIAETPEPQRRTGATLIFDAGEPVGSPDTDAGADAGAGADMGPILIGGSARRPAARTPVAPPKGKTDTTATLTRGTVIPAVLETAIDSGVPGSVRALVSVDVRSADGRSLLVPRSSRLVGEYRGGGPGNGSGKNRAYVIWTRLQRPDGSETRIGTVRGGTPGFVDQYGAASVVSLVDGTGSAASAVRVRPGEPIRIMAARSVGIARTAK